MASSSRRASSATLLGLAALLLAATAATAQTVTDVEPWAPLATLYGDSRAIQLADDTTADAALASRQDPAAAETASAPKATSKKALLYSLILPGWGELSMGAKGRATGFFIAEGLIWASYAYWQVAGNLREDDYIEQANVSAGVGVSQESDDYWKLVGQYGASSGGTGTYEEELRREARDLYPVDPVAQDAYVAENLPTGDRAWTWNTSQAQDLYRDTRESSNSAYNRAKYSFAAALLNRVLSVIDVQMLRHKASKEAREGALRPSYRVMAAVEPGGGGRLILQSRF